MQARAPHVQPELPTLKLLGSSSLPHLIKVNFNQLVILAARVRYQVILELLSQVGNV